jgi:hypothetical protein
VAKAFGTSVSAIATCGLGMLASTQSRSTTACRRGACSGVTILARMEYMAILAEPKYCTESTRRATTRTSSHWMCSISSTATTTA